MQQGVGQVVAGALTAVAPGALTPGSIVVCAPRIDVVALTPGTLQRAVFPPERMDVGLTLVGVEEVVDV
jgi:hypothetical protein